MPARHRRRPNRAHVESVPPPKPSCSAMAASFEPTMIGTIIDSPPHLTSASASVRLSSEDLRCTSRRRSGSRSTRSSPAPSAAARTGSGAVEKMNARARLTITSRSARDPATHAPPDPSAFPPVCIVAATRSRSPSSSTRPDPRAPYMPVACASSTITTAPFRSAIAAHVTERRQIAIHAEHAFGDHHSASRSRSRERRLERLSSPDADRWRSRLS